MKRIFTLIIILLFTFTGTVSANTLLCENALTAPGSTASDWSAISLAVSGKEFDKDTYSEGLKNYVHEKYLTESKLSTTKSTEWHRIIIAATLLGMDATNFDGINLLNDGVFFRENLGRQGLNAYIWALIAVNSGNYQEPADAINSIENIISSILSRQNTDGSFSLKSNLPDCDITAMAIYALSAFRGRGDVDIAIDKAVSFLSLAKNEDGSFSSNGLVNAETTAQVIIALSAIGYDVTTDIRFEGVYDALLKFKTIDGFSHIYGGETDLIATYQCTCAITAAETKSAIYKAKNVHITQKAEVPTEEANSEPVISITTSLPQEPGREYETEQYTAVNECVTECYSEYESEFQTDIAIDKNKDNNPSFYIFIVILFVIILICAIIIKKPMLIFLSFLLILFSVLFLPNNMGNNIREITVFVSIDCNSINGNYEKLDDSLKETEYIPKDGVILPLTKVSVNEGSTVLDVTKKITAEYDIQFEYSQSPNDAYVQGINYIYEFSCGNLSGWMYSVNNKFAHVGCNDYILADGDCVQWLYTCDLGKDLNEVIK